MAGATRRHYYGGLDVSRAKNIAELRLMARHPLPR
ncbi:MAG: hypothetical protein JWP99_999 [Devosia sp.]|nr:hypothetical protein [Devosia sp.]